jgi:hypothetical protein
MLGKHDQANTPSDSTAGPSGCAWPAVACTSLGVTVDAEFESHGLVVAAVQGAWVKPVGISVVVWHKTNGRGHAEVGVGFGEQGAGAERDLLADRLCGGGQ